MITHIAMQTGIFNLDRLRSIQKVLEAINNKRVIKTAINLDSTSGDRKVFEILYSMRVPIMVYPSVKGLFDKKFVDNRLNAAYRAFDVDCCVLFGQDEYTDYVCDYHKLRKVEVLRFEGINGEKYV